MVFKMKKADNIFTSGLPFIIKFRILEYNYLDKALLLIYPSKQLLYNNNNN